MKPLVSVVVPVYNRAEYIEECIASVCGQTHDLVQIICVDDGSNDGSGDILSYLSGRDSRLEVITQENRGVSAARNVGLSAAKGQYVAFVDSDDVIAPGLIARLVGSMADEADFVISADWSRTIFDRSDREELLYWGLRHFALNPPWGKLYRRSIITDHNIRFFEDVSLGEDLLFNLTYLQECGRVGVVAPDMYQMRKSEVSLTRAYRPTKYAEMQLVQDRLRGLVDDLMRDEGLSTRLSSLLNFLRIKSLASAVRDLYVYDAYSSLSVSERQARISSIQDTHGSLPVDSGDLQMRLVGWVYKRFGLAWLSWGIRSVQAKRPMRV